MAKDKDPFDDLFEPFELDEGPPPPGTEPPPPAQPAPAPPQTAAPVEQAACPSCGAFNPAYNRHCEQCGARLTQEPLPVAPAPMVRATPGGRALSVLAAAVLVVALVALLVNVFRGGGDETATSTTAPATTTTAPVVDLVEIKPTNVRASAQLGEAYRAANLIDGDLTTEWQANHANELILEFTWSQPVQIEYLQIFNIEDQDRFLRNYRIEGYKIEVDDLAINVRSVLKDERSGPQRVDVASVGTTTLTLEVLSSFPSQAVGQDPPFEELVVAEVKFWGRPAG